MKNIKFINYCKEYPNFVEDRKFLYFCDIRTGEIKSAADLMTENESYIFHYEIVFNYNEIFDTINLRTNQIPVSQSHEVMYDENIFIPLINIISSSETDISMVYHRYIYEKKDSPLLDIPIRNLLMESSKKFIQNKETCEEENIMIPGLNYYFSVIINRDTNIFEKYLGSKIRDIPIVGDEELDVLDNKKSNLIGEDKNGIK